jgi:hypothetical protein
MKRNLKFARIFAMLTVVALTMMPAIAYAAGDPVTVVNNLSDYIFTLVRAVGIMAALWGVVQIALSISNHDASQRVQGFLIFAGAMLIVFAKEILQLIGAM